MKKTNKEIKEEILDIEDRIYRLKILFNEISLKVNKTDQDKKYLKGIDRSIYLLHEEKETKLFWF